VSVFLYAVSEAYIYGVLRVSYSTYMVCHVSVFLYAVSEAYIYGVLRVSYSTYMVCHVSVFLYAVSEASRIFSKVSILVHLLQKGRYKEYF
jgi:hypothetical protein